MLRSSVVLALAGSAAAFSPAMVSMTMETGRREVLKAGAAAAIAAPLLRPSEASADFKSGGWSGPNFGCKHGTAPIITIFDHHGCQRGSDNGEYTGAKANDQNDEMMVKVGVGKVQSWDAEAFLAEVFPFLTPSRK